MSEQRSKRHGRIRRWLVRPFFWGLALVALLVFALNLTLDSAWVSERAARLIEQRAGRALNRSVSVDSLRFKLLPLTVELYGVVVGGRLPSEPPLAVVPMAVVDASLYWRDGLRLELHSVWLDEPALTMIFDSEGSNLRGLGPSRAGGGRRLPLEVALDQLSITRGELWIDHQRLPLELVARGLEASLWGVEEPQWRVAAREAEITLPRALPLLAGVEVRGRLDGKTLELLTARVGGPDLKVAAHGRLEFGADRRGAIELAAETGSVLLRRLGYIDDQLAGEFDFGGRVFWQGSDWGVQGALASAALRVLSFPLERVEGVVNGDRENFELELQRAGYAGGTIAGTLRVELGPPPLPEVALDLDLDGVDLERLMTDQGWPVAGIAAGVSGPFSYRFAWRQPDRGSGWADLAVTGRRGEGLLFSGSVPLLIEGGLLRTTAARLNSGRQRIESSGSYDLDRKRGRFRFRVLSDAVEELLPMLDLEGLDSEALWWPESGHGELAGSLRLAPEGPRLDLRLELAEVASPGAAADELRGTLAIDTAGIRRMRLELLRPEAGLIVTGSIPFGEPLPAEPAFALTLDAVGWPLEEARVWLPFELPLSGPAYGALRLEGSLEEPRGVADVELRGGELFGQPVPLLAADLRFSGQRIDFEELRLSVPAGSVAAAGAWDSATDALYLELDSETLDLTREPFSAWWTGELSGSLVLAALVDGTLAEPRVVARLFASGLALDGEPLGDGGGARADLEWRGGEVRVEGSLLGLVELDGGGRLDREAVELDLAVTVAELPGLARLFGLPADLEFEGSTAGRLEVGGRPGTDQPLRAALRLERLDLRHRGLTLVALEPVELHLTPEGLRVASLYLGDPATGDDLFLIGDIGLGDNLPIDLRMQASVGTALVAPLLPGFDLGGGRLDMLATVGGGLMAPQINGQGEVRGARVVLAELPAFTGVRGALLFYPQQIVLDSVEAAFAGGRVRMGGAVGLPNEDDELSYRLQLSGSSLTLRYPEGWELRGDTELSVVSLAEGGRQIRGVVTLERALYLRRVQVGLAQLLQALFQRRRQEVETIEEELASTHLNLVISGPGALRVRNNVANLEGDVDLALRGDLAKPVLFGSVELSPGGTLQVGGSDYTIERGFLTFANPYRMEPVIDLTAITRRRDYQLSLALSGTPDRLQASLSSDPPLADLDVLGLLGAGEPRRAEGPVTGAAGFLYGQAASLVTERVNRLFDLDRFRVDPLTGSTGNISSARVTVGKQLSRDVLATYSYDPSQTEQQLLQLEWSVTRDLVLVVTQNGDGSYAVDARWETNF